jgi:C4-dicarboxylate-specific signal transduction histidine kinase
MQRFQSEEMRRAVRVGLVWMLGIVVGAGPLCTWAQDGAGEALPGNLAHLPQASGDQPPTPLTSDQERLVLDAVFARFPSVDREAMMQYIAERMPADLQDFTLLSMRDALEWRQLESRQPERYALTRRHRALERQVREQGEVVRQSSDAARDAQMLVLNGLVAEAFQVKQELMRQDLAAIRKQVDDLAALVERRETNRAAIVEQRVREVAGLVDPASW